VERQVADPNPMTKRRREAIKNGAYATRVDLLALVTAYERVLQGLEGLKVAAWSVLGPTHAAMGHPLSFAPDRCEHGTTPFYPTHPLWCDECWADLLTEVNRAARIIQEYEGHYNC
jgi:hypothetical protein